MSDKRKWIAEPYDETGGYDCMTGAIRIGPAVLDGADYGQDPNRPIDPDALKQMEADANLIAAAPELLAALEEIVDAADGQGWYQIDATFKKQRAAIAKARGDK